MTLALRSQERVRDYARQGGALTIWREINNNKVETTRSLPAVHVEALAAYGSAYQSYPRLKPPFMRSSPNPTDSSSSILPLENLIISTKVHQTVSAIAPLLPVITPETSILLLQNGMGSFETLCSLFWPDPRERPQFFLGITTHGVNSKDVPPRKIDETSEAYKNLATAHGFAVFSDQHQLSNFSFNHASVGTLKIAKVPNASNNSAPEKVSGESVESVESSESSESAGRPDQNETLNYQLALQSPLVQSLLQAPGLQTELLTYTQFVVAQIDKLVANAVINPLTSLYDCYNGELTALESIEYLVDRIVGEISSVFHAEYKSVLVPEALANALDNKRLASIVFDVITKTAENRSSMLQDVQILKDSEIDHINGYIVGLGQKHRIGTLHNKMIMEMVKSKISLGRDRNRRSIPLVNA